MFIAWGMKWLSTHFLRYSTLGGPESSHIPAVLVVERQAVSLSIKGLQPRLCGEDRSDVLANLLVMVSWVRAMARVSWGWQTVSCYRKVICERIVMVGDLSWGSESSQGRWFLGNWAAVQEGRCKLVWEEGNCACTFLVWATGWMICCPSLRLMDRLSVFVCFKWEVGWEWIFF